MAIVYSLDAAEAFMLWREGTGSSGRRLMDAATYVLSVSFLLQLTAAVLALRERATPITIAQIRQSRRSRLLQLVYGNDLSMQLGAS